jgi:diguanylate cyclase (GGDEF)-like protein
MCQPDQAELQRLLRKYERERRARLQAEAIAEQFTRDALHDPLTKLPNRSLFLDRLRLALSRAGRLQSLVAVLFLDLDGFKSVNDSLGHTAGDQLLIEVAERLRQCLRPADTVARLGGDEFGILLEDVGRSEGEHVVADRILMAVRTPVVVEGKELVIQASIGIALGASTDEAAGDLLRQADLAMYAAKADGKDRHRTFDPAMHATALARLELEAELRHALDREQLGIHYQPVCELPTGRLIRTEALVRWHHPRRGLIPPAEFIPIAEERGLIVPLGQWVLRQACHQTRRWQQRHPSEPPSGWRSTCPPASSSRPWWTRSPRRSASPGSTRDA